MQLPVRLGGGSIPEPDIAVVRPADDYYASGHPTAEDVLLAVEVADSSVVFDARVKHQAYATSRIPIYWLVDPTRDVVVVHVYPAGDRYAERQTMKRGATLMPSTVPSLEVTVQEILG